jgi:hypothetical protein
MSKETSTSELHVVVERGGQTFSTPLLEIHRKHVVTRFGKSRFSSVKGYRLRWHDRLNSNEHLFPRERP